MTKLEFMQRYVSTKDSDDVNDWEWNIRGSFPSEVWYGIDEYAADRVREALDRIEGVIAEFGEDPVICAPIIGEEIEAIKNELAN